eukprot:1489340-Pyramimonas_sp.AAC.1
MYWVAVGSDEDVTLVAFNSFGVVRRARINARARRVHASPTGQCSANLLPGASGSTISTLSALTSA